MREYQSLKVKDDFNLDELQKLGFIKKDYSNKTGYAYLGIQYEFTNYYPIEDDGTQYVDDEGNNYNARISISAEYRTLFVEILNNDCSYHTEGSEIDPILIKIYELSTLGALEIKHK